MQSITGTYVSVNEDRRIFGIESEVRIPQSWYRAKVHSWFCSNSSFVIKYGLSIIGSDIKGENIRSLIKGKNIPLGQFSIINAVVLRRGLSIFVPATEGDNTTIDVKDERASMHLQ